MAAARDQAARIVRAGPETAEVEAEPEAGTPLADSCGLTSRKKPGVDPPRRQALPKPNRQPRRPPAPPMRRRNLASANSS